jgi:hypothetical protein
MGSWLVGALLIAFAFPALARADGAFPDELPQIAAPADVPGLLVVATNFGLLRSDDDGAHFHWVCEAAIGMSRINQYAVSPISPHSIYATSFTGLAVSRDRACGWAQAGGSIAGLIVDDVFPDPSDNLHVLALAALTGDGGSGTTGLLESRDGGATFGSPLLSAPALGDLVSVEVARTDQRTIYAANYQTSPLRPGLERSTDGGATWQTIDLAPVAGTRVVRILAVDPDDARTIYLRAVADNGADALLISHDGGTTTQVVLPLSASMSAFLRRADRSILVGTKGAGIYVSTDAGATFRQLAPKPSLRGLAERGGILYGTADNFADHFAVGSSRDGGLTWQPLLTFDHICGPLECGQISGTCQLSWQQQMALFGISPGVCPAAKPKSDGCAYAAAATHRPLGAASVILAFLGVVASSRAARRLLRGRDRATGPLRGSRARRRTAAPGG